MNSGITLVDVRQEAFEAIRLVKAGKLDLKGAQTIKGFLDTVIDTAKTQVEYMKSLPNSVKEKLTVEEVKAVAGTLQDRDTDLDITMHKLTEGEKAYAIDD
jgi:hypothetical protein